MTTFAQWYKNTIGYVPTEKSIATLERRLEKLDDTRAALKNKLDDIESELDMTQEDLEHAIQMIGQYEQFEMAWNDGQTQLKAAAKNVKGCKGNCKC